MFLSSRRTEMCICWPHKLKVKIRYIRSPDLKWPKGQVLAEKFKLWPASISVDASRGAEHRETMLNHISLALNYKKL